MDGDTKIFMSLFGRNFRHVALGEWCIQYDCGHGNSNIISVEYRIYDIHSELQRSKCLITLQHSGTQKILFQVVPVTDSMTRETHGSTSLLELNGDKFSFSYWDLLPPYESCIKFTILFHSLKVDYELY